jgi:hypothetical protein
MILSVCCVVSTVLVGLWDHLYVFLVSSMVEGSTPIYLRGLCIETMYLCVFF